MKITADDLRVAQALPDGAVLVRDAFPVLVGPIEMRKVGYQVLVWGHQIEELVRQAEGDYDVVAEAMTEKATEMTQTRRRK